MLNINIPVSLNASVECQDGSCGKISEVIVNPVTKSMTHIVVQDKSFEGSDQRLVPLNKLTASELEWVRLGCTKAELAAMEPFTKTHYIKTEESDYSLYDVELSGFCSDPEPIMALPYAIPTVPASVPVEDEQIPLGDMTVRRGAIVEATDGDVGRVDEFLLDPGTGHITYLVMRQGHLWATREIAIPVKAINDMIGNTVVLNLDKQSVEALLELPIDRNY